MLNFSGDARLWDFSKLTDRAALLEKSFVDAGFRNSIHVKATPKTGNFTSLSGCAKEF